MLRSLLSVSLLLALVAACSKQPETQTAPKEKETTAAEPVGKIGRDAIGRIYHYVRTNQDGSDPESVYVFRKTRDFLEVYKMRRKCTNAAFVTARLDMEKGYATHLTGGRLKPNAGHENFATLDYDENAKRLSARFAPPGGDAKTAEVFIEDEPWHDYDFDFASLTVMTPHLEPRADFSFGLTLIIPDPERDDFLMYLGRADLVYRQDEMRGGRSAYRYIVGGPAFGTFGGSMWLDAEDGHILDVETGIPNHREYENFKLELESVNDGGQPAWTKLLTAHYEGCDEDAG